MAVRSIVLLLCAAAASAACPNVASIFLNKVLSVFVVSQKHAELDPSSFECAPFDQGGVEMHGRCWYLGAEGATCGQTCAAQAAKVKSCVHAELRRDRQRQAMTRLARD